MATQVEAEVVLDEPAINELAGDLRAQVSRINYQLKASARASGVTPTRMTVLATLAQQDGCRSGDLAERLGISPGSMTRLVEVLVAAGWVNRERDDSDHRAQRLLLTDEGRRLLASIRADGTSKLRERMSHLSSDELAALAAAAPVLRKLADGMFA
jgi:DNA-binding MarR family transcriptional regulator